MNEEPKRSLEKWIAEIQYQALSDNYLVMPKDWAERIELDLEPTRDLAQASCGEVSPHAKDLP